MPIFEEMADFDELKMEVRPSYPSDLIAIIFKPIILQLDSFNKITESL